MAADSISATALAPVPDSKHGLNSPSNCISDMIEPVLTASYINNPPGTACASPSKALSVEHGQILINDGEVFGGQEVQHHLSGSLLTGRSGAASRKKPTARALQPRAATVPDSRI